MSHFSQHDPNLDDPEDHRTDFDRWVASWVWHPNAIIIYVALVVMGLASGFFKWVAGFLIVCAFLMVLLIGASIQELRGNG